MPERAFFWGRELELARIDEILDSTRHGMGGVLVIMGVAGQGKSTLLNAAADHAADLQVTHVAGIETEMRLGYAGLHQILRPHLGDGLRTLAVPQRRAVEIVFGYREGTRPDPFLVGLASLDLLSRAGARRPMLCLVDDVQWLDPETTDVLTFVGRRLLADSVGLILAARSGPEWQPPADLPVFELGGLDDEAALSIVLTASNPPATVSVAKAIVAQAGGNPLALKEIPSSLDADQRSGRRPLPTPLPVGPRLEQTLTRSLDQLPERCRAILLLAAADPTGSSDLLWRSAAAAGLTSADLVPAERAAVITVNESVRFRHPLLRSAAYWAADPAQRQTAHAVIAAVMPVHQDFALRAWQVAKAADGPNETVAAALEDAGDRAVRHGASSGAATSYRMATDFSVAADARLRRALKAAETLTTIGSAGQAQEILSRTTDDLPLHPSVSLIATIARLRSRILFQQGRPSDAAASILEASQLLAVRDLRTSRDILIEAMAQSLISERLAPRGTTIADLAAAANELPLPPAAIPTLPDILLEAYVAYFRHGLPLAGPAMRAAIDAVVLDRRTGAYMLPWLRAAATAAGYLADHEVQWALARRLQIEARALDDVEGMYRSSMMLGNLALVGGRLSEAEGYFAEIAAIDEARGRPFTYGRLLVAAWRGDASRTASMYEVVVAEATQYEQGYQLPRAEWARAIIGLATGDFEAAYLALAPYAAPDSTLQYALPDTIEAAVRAGRLDDAHRIFEILVKVAEANPQDRLLGYVSRCRALIYGDQASTEADYLDAITRHHDDRRPSHEARSRLVYGEWLRRSRRLIEARTQLQPAHDAFRRLGMAAFAARAGNELRLAGVAVSTPTPIRRLDLSGQEGDVARLAASGLTNTQIAGQLFISASTVDYHLRKVFRKLSISSRRDLGEALGDEKSVSA